MSEGKLENTIPQDKLVAVKEALDQVFGLRDVTSIHQMAGTLSNALVYMIIIDHKSYLLRIMMKAGNVEDLKKQYACARLASEYGVSPYVYYFNCFNGISITDFVHTVPYRKCFFSQEQLLFTLGKTIRAMHSLPLFPVQHNFFDGVGQTIEQFKALNMFPQYITGELFDCYAKIQSVYPLHEQDIVSSHNDLNPNNLLFDGKQVWIIDWEKAFKNDPYVDLAMIANHFVEDDNQEEFLLTAYFGDKLSEYTRARFFLMQQVCHVYQAMQMLRDSAEAKPAEFVHHPEMNVSYPYDIYQNTTPKDVLPARYNAKLNYGKALLNTALENIKSERFRFSIGLLSAIN